MKKNVNCKIVQDLLPNYIEGLTNEETNEYIENHLKECSECKEILKEMGEEIILDKIDEKIKIDYLKKIKNRNKTIITIIVVIAIAIITTMIVFFNSIGGVALDENGNPQYYEAFIKWITGESKIKTSRVTNIILKNKDDKVKATIVMTFDENDICIGARYCVEEETEEKAIEKYNRWKNIENGEIPVITNVRREDKKLIYNYSYWNRKTKEEVKKQILNDNDYYLMEEI